MLQFVLAYRMGMKLESAQSFLDEIPDDDGPACLVVEAHLPEMSGLEIQDYLVKIGSTLPIVFVGADIDIQTTVRMIKAGAEDVLEKPIIPTCVKTVVEKAIARQQVLRERHRDLIRLHSLVSKLTKREQQVFALLVQGKINRQIASDLDTKERTIKAHRQKVMEKMKAGSLADLVVLAARLAEHDGCRI